MKLLAVILVAVTAIYGLHLHNDFHFDDSHTIVQNPHIHSMRNMTAFFANADMSSVLPANRTYRPVLFASLAIDWWVGKGNVAWFHLSTLVWFLTLIWLVFIMAVKICGPVWHVPIFAAGLFGLHPACAETVNYIIQRSELQSTLGVVAGLVLYIHGSRRLYLVPMVIGILAKQTAVVFPVLLFFYLLVVDDERPRRAFRRVLPALLVTSLFGVICAYMIPSTFTPGAYSPWAYQITQPLVALRFFAKFFIPTGLSADTDHAPLSSIFDAGGVEGFLFIGGLIAVIVWASKRSDMKPITFGLTWFLVALLPTSLMAVSEVENDHRMFFPFVGMAIAASWAFHLAMLRKPQWGIAAVASAILAVFAVGAWQRCEVWRTEETLWRDVTIKSPSNGRGLMNYGLTLMAHGDYASADYYFTRATFFTPNYYILEINRGIISDAMNRRVEADMHFKRAAELSTDAYRVMQDFPVALRYVRQ